MIGRGSFGEVWKVTKDGRVYALKITRQLKGDFETEFASTIKLNSRYLVEYLEAFRSGKNVYIVMEFCKEGDLGELLKKQSVHDGKMINTHRLMKISIQLFLALVDLHKRFILHRDIKLENIFISENDDVKLGDFGLGKMLQDGEGKANTFLGTPAYMAPELFHENRKYDAKIDVWALGVTLYQVCTLEYPFKDVAAIVKGGNYKPISSVLYSEAVIGMINSMLERDPAKRPSALELLRLPAVQEVAKSLGMLNQFPPEAQISHPSSTPSSPSPTADSSLSSSRSASSASFSNSSTSASLTDSSTSASFSNSSAPISVVSRPEGIDVDVAEYVELEAEEHPECTDDDFRAHFEEYVGPLSEKNYHRKLVRALRASNIRDSTDSGRDGEVGGHRDIVPSLDPADLWGCSITQTSAGIRCLFSDFIITVFLSTPITKGIYRWVIKIKFDSPPSKFWIGATPTNLLREKGLECKLAFSKSADGTVTSRSVKPWFIAPQDRAQVPDEMQVPDESFVALEADTEVKTLSFFVNEKKVPIAFSNISAPLTMGVTGMPKHSFLSLSLQSLASSTPSSVECKRYNEQSWGNNNIEREREGREREEEKNRANDRERIEKWRRGIFF